MSETCANNPADWLTGQITAMTVNHSGRDQDNKQIREILTAVDAYIKNGVAGLTETRSVVDISPVGGNSLKDMKGVGC